MRIGRLRHEPKAPKAKEAKRNHRQPLLTPKIPAHSSGKMVDVSQAATSGNQGAGGSGLGFRGGIKDWRVLLTGLLLLSRARAHWGFANSKIGQNPLAPPSRNLIHADQACGDNCVFCMCVENMRVRPVHIGGKASTYVSVMRLYADFARSRVSLGRCDS